MEPQTVSFVIAFGAGCLSFVSPCVLPLVPSYIAFITGLSLDEIANQQDRSSGWAAGKHSLLFILGFSTVFILFGASASAVGQMFVSFQGVIRQVGGILIVIFGLYILGVLKLPFLMLERRVHFHRKPAGHVGTFLVGMAFAAGWTPCVGPILGSILLYASTTESLAQGIGLLVFYSMGLGLPLFLASLGIHAFLSYFQKIRLYLRIFSMVSGILLIIIGIMISTNSFASFAAFLTQHGIGWYIGQ